MIMTLLRSSQDDRWSSVSTSYLSMVQNKLWLKTLIASSLDLYIVQWKPIEAERWPRLKMRLMEERKSTISRRQSLGTNPFWNFNWGPSNRVLCLAPRALQYPRLLTICHSVSVARATGPCTTKIFEGSRSDQIRSNQIRSDQIRSDQITRTNNSENGGPLQQLRPFPQVQDSKTAFGPAWVRKATRGKISWSIIWSKISRIEDNAIED